MQKIAEASIELDELNAKLAIQKVVVAQKTKSCEALLEEITIGKFKICMTCFKKVFD